MTKLDKLRITARFHAARELEAAGQMLREAEAAGRHTNLDRLRVRAAQERWDLLVTLEQPARGLVA